MDYYSSKSKELYISGLTMAVKSLKFMSVILQLTLLHNNHFI